MENETMGNLTDSPISLTDGHTSLPYQQVQATAWQTQATAYELLAFTFRYPDAFLVSALASGEWAEAAREVAGALDLDLPDGWDAELACYKGVDPEGVGPENTVPAELLHTLRAEATRLFVGAPNPVVSPFEGVWRAQADGVQALLFVNPHSMEVERFMKECCIGRPDNTNEPLDHIATELEFLQWLCMMEAGAADGRSSDAAPERTWSDTYERFLEEHARTWMPQFAVAVGTESREPFYRTATELLKAVVTSEK